MRITSQNLNEKPGSDTIVGSMLWHGRAWLKKSDTYDELGRIEWLLGKKARDFSAYITFGPGDDERGIMFHLCLPFLFSVFLTLEIGWIKACDRRLGVATHSDAIWFYLFPVGTFSGREDEQRWYRKTYSWSFPWQYDWYSTEVLTQHTPELARTVYIEKEGDRKRLGIDSFAQFRLKDKAAESVSETHDYKYIRKNGNVQNRKATIHVERMVWRMRWWPVLPFKKISTSINVSFDDEVGERTGSWKGGTVGCGYDMRPNETPWECLRRMERERKF